MIAGLLLAGPTFATTIDIAAPTPQVRHAFDLRVPVAPAPLPVAGTPRLVYELHLTNFAPDTLALTGLQVLAGDDARQIAEFDTGQLAHRIGRLSPEVDDPLLFAPGASAVIYLELPLDVAAPPRELLHRVAFDVVDAQGRTPARITGARIALDRQPPAVLGPPLRGGPWVAIFDASWPRGHRRMVYAVDGTARIPGRYAIDWVQLDAQGREFPPGHEDEAAARHGYSEPVLAVADAVVAAVRDGIAESATISGRSKNPLGKAAGNYLALDLGDGRHVLYEHLQPGSLRVAVGDRVERGQVIAALGFTGDSTGPHLHLHVADAAAPLGAEGLPYVFDRYRLLGRYDSIEAVGSQPWPDADDAPPQYRQRPAPLSVVEFP
ncbi:MULTISPECIES: peptidoglycan DD-metalloendopeptidase family protein [unclassified Lysobacter]